MPNGYLWDDEMATGESLFVALQVPPTLPSALTNIRIKSQGFVRESKLAPRWGKRKTRELRSHGWRRQAGSKGVILNMATEAETIVKKLQSRDRDVALKPDGGFRKARTLAGDNNLTLQALTRFERLFRGAIEAFASEIFGGALNRWSFGLPEQTHRPM